MNVTITKRQAGEYLIRNVANGHMVGRILRTNTQRWIIQSGTSPYTTIGQEARLKSATLTARYLFNLR